MRSRRSNGCTARDIASWHASAHARVDVPGPERAALAFFTGSASVSNRPGRSRSTCRPAARGRHGGLAPHRGPHRPCHVCQLALRAVDDVRHAERREPRKVEDERALEVGQGHARAGYSPRAPVDLPARSAQRCPDRRCQPLPARGGAVVPSCHLEHPRAACEHLPPCLRWATRSTLKRFIKPARTAATA